MGWWILAMLSWLAGVGWQVSQPEVASSAVIWGVAGLNALLLAAALVWYRWYWARLGVLTLLGLAWAITSWRAAYRLAEQVPPDWDQPVMARVQIDSLVQTGSGFASFDAQVLAYQVPDAMLGSSNWRPPDQMPGGVVWPRAIAVRLNGASGRDEMPKMEAGQQWEMPLRLHVPDGAANPGGYDVELGYWERGVRGVAQARAAQAHQVSSRGAWFWQGSVDRLRGRIRDRIQAQVPDPHVAGVLAGLAVGDQSAIDKQDWDVFRQTGVAHLVSISGGHVAMFGWLAAFLIRPIWIRSGRLAWRLPSPYAARVGAVIAATLYALLAGWGVPAQRTVITMAVFTLLHVSGRQWPWPMVWLLAAVAVTAWDPWACMQAGFWLSFVAVGILMASGPSLRTSHMADGSWGWRMVCRVGHEVRQLWRTQWRITVGLAPLTLVFFQQASWMSLPANLLAIPLFTLVITPLALLGAVAAPLWSVGAVVVDWSVHVLAQLAHAPITVMQVPLLPGWTAVCVVMAGAAMIWPMRWAWRLMCVPMLLPLVWLPSAWQVWSAPPSGQFSALAADVGQGSAILIRTAHHALLFDAGPKVGSASDAGARVLAPLLRSVGLPRLDAVMISHADTDHIGGAASVFKAVAVDQLWSSLPSAHALRQTPSAQGLVPVHHECVAGQSWVWDGVLFQVLRPSVADLARRDRLPDNAVSCVLQIRAMQGTGRVALLTGDIEAAQEQALVAEHGASGLRADLLVVPHHGSKTSSTASFLAAVQPAQSVIQVGRRNRYGHPAPSVLARYETQHLPYVSTPTCGALLWRSDADTAPGACWRQQHRHYWQAPNPSVSSLGGESAGQ